MDDGPMNHAEGSLGPGHRDALLAFSRHVLDEGGPLADRLAAWSADTLEGGVR